MAYVDIVFRGDYMLAERVREQRDRFTAHAFGAWQQLTAQGLKMSWDQYIARLGLAEKKPKASKEDLAREAAHAMGAAEKIIERARRGRR